MFGLPTKKPAKEEKPLTIREQREAERRAEQKKRVNIFLTRGSGESGATGYQTSRSAFAGGEVESRSRVSHIGSDNEGQSGLFTAGKVKNKPNSASGAFGGQVVKTGFAQSGKTAPPTGTGANKPPVRPLGFGR
jgi:hypothetical protein